MIIAAISFVLSSCAPVTVPATTTEAAATTTETTATTTEAAATEEKPYEGETITVWYWPDDTGLAKKIFSEFTDKTGITVKQEDMTLDWNEYCTQIVTYLSQGYEGIDVYWLPEVNSKSFMEAGWLEPLDDVFSKEDLADFPQGFLEAACQSGGKTYIIPTSNNVMVLFYSKEAFDKAGVDLPKEGWNWDDLVKIGKSLTLDTNKDGEIDQWGLILSGAQGGYLFNDINHFVTQAGGNLADFNDPKTQEAIKFYYDLIWTNKIAPSNTPQQDYLTGMEMFMEGKGAILFTWNNLKASIEAKKPDAFKNKEFWVLPMFSGPEKAYTMNSNWGWAVGAGSKHKGAAKEFIKFIASPEVQIEWSPKFLPTRASVLKDPGKLADPIMAEICANYLPVSSARQFFANQSEFETIVSDVVGKYITKQISFDEMVKQATERLAALSK
jgi:ABC-type glycerol-3-phosphate transport system substrate-binding protein